MPHSLLHCLCSPCHSFPSPPPPGIDAFGFEDRRRVQQAFIDLRMERPAARAVLDDVARK